MGTEAEEPIEDFRLDRTQFSVARLTDPDEERLRALEHLRRTFYGYTSATEGYSESS